GAAERAAARRNKLFHGALRDKPIVRFAAGAVLALLVGWVGSAPYARHAERGVLALQQQANAVRYRIDPEVRAQARVLDEQADELASGAAYRVGVLWLVVAAVAFGVWLFVT